MLLAQTTVTITQTTTSFSYVSSPPLWLCVAVGLVMVSFPPLILWLAARRDARRDVHR